MGPKHEESTMLRTGIWLSQLSVMVLATGCPSMEGGNGAGDGAATFAATLNGSQETQSVTTGGSGTGTFSLNDDRTMLNYSITASGLSGPVVSAHFHRGAAGVAGPVVHDISDRINESNGQVTLEGTWALTAADIEGINDGLIYVNLHTAQHPAGEIRGQLETAE
jgi:hypothetical protein